MSTTNDDRELKLAQLLQELSSGDSSSIESTEVSSRLEQFTNEELQQLHAAGSCLNLLKKFGQIKNTDIDETLATSADTNPTSKAQPSSLDQLEIPTQIGRFQILKLEAQGGMASIFRAMDPILQREVALKVPLSNVLAQDPTIGERFRREGQAVALLSHPAIVPVFDAGEENGMHYISYQWIPGQNLQQFLKQNSDAGDGRLDVRDCAAALARLASAVAHAHAKGILHRDIKPANVLIDETLNDLPWYERLRITDFGLAKAFNETSTILTADESIIGTPAYMSPEAVKGNGQVDQRADVYSLGALFYELLVGSPPHKRSTYISTIRAIESEPIPSLRKQHVEIPADVEAVCLKCLANDPADRYSSAFALESDLQRFLDGRPVLARRISSAGKLQRWAKRNPIIAGSLLLTLTSLLVGIIATTWMWGQSETNRIQAVLAQKEAEQLQHSESAARREAELRAGELAQQIEILREIFSDLDPQAMTVSGGSLRERLAEKLIKSSQLIANSSQLPSQRILLMSSLSQALAQLGRPNEAHSIVNQAIELAGDQVNDDEFLHLQVALAFSHASLSQFSNVTEILGPLIDRIIDSEESTLKEKVEAANLLADSWFQIATTTGSSASLPPAEAGYRRVLQLLNSLETIPDDLQVVNLASRFRLVTLEEYPDLTATQFDSLNQILKQAEATLGADSAAYNTMLWTLAHYYASDGQHATAIVFAEKAWQLADKNFGRDSSISISALNVLVAACGQANKKRRLREILPIAQHGCEVLIERKGESHQNVMIIYGNVAIAWGIVGRLDKCIEIKRRLVELGTEKFGRDSPQTQAELVGLGAALRVNGNLTEASEVYEEFQAFLKTFPDRDQRQWKQRAKTVSREQIIIAGLKLLGAGKLPAEIPSNADGQGEDDEPM